jgi:hypothetical protein
MKLKTTQVLARPQDRAIAGYADAGDRQDQEY